MPAVHTTGLHGDIFWSILALATVPGRRRCLQAAMKNRNDCRALLVLCYLVSVRNAERFRCV